MTDYSLLQDFIVETVEHLEEMESNLLRLEANPGDRETLDNIFRSVHTIKGASEYLGLESLAELSHKLENLLDRLRRSEFAADRHTVDLVMAVRDRMGLLVEDLESTQNEETVIADLVERLEAMKTRTRSESASPAESVDAPPSAEASGSDEATYEEEFDEELFAIFLEQLEEGLAELAAHTRTLTVADRDDQIAILGNCLTRLEPLRASANYMGYDPLTDLYDGWSESIRNARERLEASDDGFMPDFIRDYMAANLANVARRFPRIQIDLDAPAGTAALDAEEAGHQPSEPSVDAKAADDSDLLDSFALQAPSSSSPPAGTPTTVADEAPDLFDRLSRSFDDCRRQGVAPQRAAGTAEIAAELFSTPEETVMVEDNHVAPSAAHDTEPAADQTLSAPESAGGPSPAPPPEPGAPGLDGDEDALFSAPENKAAAETPQASAETPSTALSPDSDNYDEEYDEELFGIFLEQLEESLAALKAQAAALARAEAPERDAILAACLMHIDPLRSSANYMGYATLTALYDDWAVAIQDARSRLAEGQDDFLNAFIRVDMEANIDAVVERFPQVRLPEVPHDAAAPTSDIDAPPGPEASFDGADAASVDLPEAADDRPESVTGAHLPAEADEAAIEAAGRENQKLENSLLNDFLVETMEHLEEMENSLLQIEQTPEDQGTLDDIFRSVHTIKGAAEYLGMARIAELSHQLENLLDQMRRNERPADCDAIDLLIAARDRIGLLTEDLEQTGAEQNAIDDLLDRIRGLQANAPSPPLTTAVDPEVNSTTASRERETPDFEIPLFAESEDEPLLAEGLPGAAAADVIPELASITASAATADDDTGPPADPAASANRRDPERSGRRQSDRIGDKILKQSIRVDAAKIDALMNQVGELVVSRAWFAQLFSEMRELQQSLKQRFKLDTREMKQVKGLTFRLSEATVALGRVANELQEGVMKVRMLPIAQLFNRYPRLVFDLVRDTDKQVALDIRGEETELDKMVIEEISDPLIHIIRNAVDHGVEPVEERQRQGKPEAATIRLEAYHEGNHVVIEIADDGRGLDIDRIRAKALAGNFATRDELDRMTPKELSGLIMLPGFSTAEKITHTSGRGVGMDVVKKNIEKLNGTIEIDTTPGVATRFRIKIPLTLAIIPALLIKVRGELFTIPLATVEETLRIGEEHISTIEGVEVMQLRENTLPLVRLDGLFRMNAAGALDRAFVVVVSTGLKRVGLVVDELLGQEEVVIKPLEDYLQERSGFSGATILGDGRISLILDVYELVNLSIDREAQKKAKAAVL
ncbi:MAG: Hpt domain-containing protein [Desulfobacterales bacterium]|nr:Hpt domain-containing protein [Desulfobacterales bacterium]